MYYACADPVYNIVYYSDAETYLNGIPSGAIPITDDQWQDGIDNPGKYVIQNGVFVQAPAPTAVDQLAAAKAAQKALLNQSFEKAIAGGFSSSATGTAVTYAIDPIAMAKWTGILANINSGKLTSNIMVKDINGNKVTLTPTQFPQMAMDGFDFFNSQEQNLWTKDDDVDAIELANYSTTQDAINAVQTVTY